MAVDADANDSLDEGMPDRVEVDDDSDESESIDELESSERVEAVSAANARAFALCRLVVMTDKVTHCLNYNTVYSVQAQYKMQQ